MNESMTKTSIQMPLDLLNASSNLAERKGLSLAALIRMLLIEYLQREEKKKEV
jgi:metal-responsive CopG/Arc/MetJ family transcriptional regulator